MTKKHLYLILIFISALFSCMKHDVKPTSDFPVATQTGANVVAWHADSIPYIARGFLATLATVQLDTNVNNGSYYNTIDFRIQTSLIDSNGYELAIQLDSPEKITTPIKPGSMFPIQGYSTTCIYEVKDPYVMSNEVILGATGGEIVITKYDPEKKIISGTFNFSTISHPLYPTKVVKGWFDITFTLYKY